MYFTHLACVFVCMFHTFSVCVIVVVVVADLPDGTLVLYYTPSLSLLCALRVNTSGK